MTTYCKSPFERQSDALMEVLELPLREYNVSRQDAVRFQTHRRVVKDNTSRIASAEAAIDAFEYTDAWLKQANAVTRLYFNV